MPADKRKILVAICKTTKITEEEKKALQEQVLGDEKSDDVNRCRLTCEAAIATPENKEKMWKIFTEENSKYSIYDRDAYMAGFCSWD